MGTARAGVASEAKRGRVTRLGEVLAEAARTVAAVEAGHAAGNLVVLG